MRDGAPGVPFSDGWYSAVPGVSNPHAALRRTPVVRRLPPRLLRAMWRVGALRGALLFAASTVHPVVGCCREDPGWSTLLALRALLGRRRKLVILQFIAHDRRHPLRALLLGWDRWATRRAMLRGHVLSRAEVAALAERYRVPAQRFEYVPWPLESQRPKELVALADEPLVLVAGRAYCDWETVFAAARGRDWPLHVVCAARDLRRVRRLDEEAGHPAREVRAEIPREEYEALLGRATVLGVVLKDEGRSAGQIRTADALSSGTPLVVTDGTAIRDYVEHEETALVVAPGDAQALGEAVDRLLQDRALADALRTKARERAAAWTREDYLRSLAPLLHGTPSRLPHGAPGATGGAPAPASEVAGI